MGKISGKRRIWTQGKRKRGFHCQGKGEIPWVSLLKGDDPFQNNKKRRERNRKGEKETKLTPTLHKGK